MSLELANVPVNGKMIKRRKREDNEAGVNLAKKRLRKQMSEGIINAVGEKILNGEIKILQREQKFLQQKRGTAQYKSATNGRGKKQSYLNDDLNENDAQDIIIYNCGLGDPDIRDGRTREYIDLDKFIGSYYDGNNWVKTKRIMIDYSQKGAHIIPVQEK